jgi:hypothetical protein
MKMGKDLKEISLLHPKIFKGDDLDLDEFCDLDNDMKTELLAFKDFTLCFLNNSAFAASPEVDIDELSKFFSLAPKEIRSDKDIILTAANADPHFLSSIEPSLIQSEHILSGLKIANLVKKEGDYKYFEYLASCYFEYEDTLAWKDKRIVDGLVKIFNNPSTSAIAGSPLWLDIQDCAHQDLFNDLECLRNLLLIFLKGQSGAYETDDAGENYEFFDRDAWRHWSDFIDLSFLEEKLLQSPHYLNKDIQSLLLHLAFIIENQEPDWFDQESLLMGEYTYLASAEDLKDFLTFLKTNPLSISTDDKWFDGEI